MTVLTITIWTITIWLALQIPGGILLGRYLQRGLVPVAARGRSWR
jgi:hypothetical protein